MGLLLLLGLVAAVSRAHHTPGGQAGIHTPPSGVGDYVFTIFAVTILGATAALGYLWFSERHAMAQTRRAGGRRGTYRALVLVLVLLALLPALGSRLHLFGSKSLQAIHAKVHGGAGPNAKRHNLRPAPQRAPKLEWIPIAIAGGLGLLILGYVGLRTLRRAGGQLLEQHLLERRFEELLDDTLDDLYAQQDPRKAIIAAYARMEQLFASSGLPRAAHEAPLEYLGRALGELRASGAALGRLTGLFERAKFSAHEMNESTRSEAIEALTQVRDELRIRREEDRLHREQADAAQAERLDRMEDAGAGEDPFAAAADKARGSIYSGGRF